MLVGQGAGLIRRCAADYIPEGRGFYFRRDRRDIFPEMGGFTPEDWASSRRAAYVRMDVFVSIGRSFILARLSAMADVSLWLFRFPPAPGGRWWEILPDVQAIENKEIPEVAEFALFFRFPDR